MDIERIFMLGQRPQLFDSTNIRQTSGCGATQNIEVITIFGGNTSGVYNQGVAVQ